jgi:hypothetical protein
MDDDENSLLWYLIEVDTVNYELIDDEDEEVHAMVACSCTNVHNTNESMYNKTGPSQVSVFSYTGVTHS